MSRTTTHTRHTTERSAGVGAWYVIRLEPGEVKGRITDGPFTCKETALSWCHYRDAQLVTARREG